MTKDDEVEIEERGPCNSNIWPNGIMPYDRRLGSTEFLETTNRRTSIERVALIRSARRYSLLGYGVTSEE